MTTERYFGEHTPKLGFGLMRLPKKDGGIDIGQVKRMVDLFIGAGFTYFDTAYVYDGGESEKAIGEALVKRYPRDSYTLATKLNAWAAGVRDEKDAKGQLFTSLERTGAEYFDYYLLHALQRSNYTLYDKYHLWDFVKEMKAKGLIRHYGFSFHADPKLLDELLTKHPDVEFVQLQINYADWENPGVQSGKCYEIARKHNKAVTVMEPVKGGALANPVSGVRKILKEADENASYASWAIRFSASLDGIITVLSGMSNEEQMRDNISYMKDFKGFTKEQAAVMRRARAALGSDDMIPCTACHYCTDGCPMSIPIPEIFSVANRQRGNEDFRGRREYVVATTGRGKASDCVECGQCERACPQGIKIITRLKECARKFE